MTDSVDMRTEHKRLLTGTGKFVADVDVPGQAWLSVVRSPVAHGHLKSVDVAGATSVPGVLHAFSAADLHGDPPKIPIRVVPVAAMQERLQHVIAHDRVRYVGEPVAIVIAETQYLAEDAAERVRVEIDPIPPVVDCTDASPQSLWDAPGGNVLCDFRSTNGDIDAILNDAHTVIRGEFRIQRHTGLPIETRGLVAEWDSSGTLHLWGVVKYVHFTRRTVAAFFGIDVDRVVCHHVDVGGMFGVRGEVYPEDFLTPWAAKLTGRPVKWVEDRREHLLSINHSREHVHRYELAVAADGKFLGYRDDVLIDLGAYPRPIGGRLAELALEALPGPYRWSAFSARARGIATNKAPAGTMRGPSTFEATFVRERAIDIAARELGLDPFLMRVDNLIPGELLPYDVDLGSDMKMLQYDTGDYPALARQLAHDIDLDSLRSNIRHRRGQGEKVGIGVGFFVDHSGLGREETVTLDLLEDGSFRVATSGSEIGQGLASMIETVVSDRLGVPRSLVDVVTNDSQAQGEGSGTFASRSTVFVGSASHDAACQLESLARVRAEELSQVGLDVLRRVEDGFSSENTHVHWKDVAPLSVDGRHVMEDPTFGFGLHLAVVSVDDSTGAVAVERLHVAYDCGRAVDPTSVEGQLRGASIHGFGGALLEELFYDESGQLLTTTFMDYLLPTAMESPRVDVHVFESGPVPRNPLGAKGVGEAGIMGVAAAIANGVADALGLEGAELTTLPLKPDVIFSLPSEKMDSA